MPSRATAMLCGQRGPFQKQFTNIIPIYSGAASSFYHSPQVTATKRYSQALQMPPAYTWANNIDDGLQPSG